jgi:hypothetical protein
MAKQNRQSLFFKAYSFLALHLGRAFERARLRVLLFRAKRNLIMNLKIFGNGSKPTLSEEYYFLGCCAILYSIYGFIPDSYIKEIATVIDESHLSKQNIFNPDIHFKGIH